MKTKEKIALLLAAGTIAGLLIYSYRLRKAKKHDKALQKIADEGYETAHDVLYPGRRKKGGRLHYGPVLPS